MIQITDPSECSGCTACFSICGHDAITMKPDRLGFMYPQVNADKCVGCGLCVKICPFHDDYATPERLSQPEALCGRINNEQILKTSQSGGAYTAISDVILQRGGVVYGASFSDGFKVTHTRAVKPKERDRHRGSKYIQSNLGETFRAVRKDLTDGLTVLFTGTPCQTAGIRAYIPEKLQKSLFLVDLICHGVPAPAIWFEYLNYLERSHNDKIIAANFRDTEKFGWRQHFETFRFEHKPEIVGDSFRKIFYLDLSLRESCYECKFCNLKRTGDLTIGDFWGCDKIYPDWADDDKGVSLILANTPKGQSLLNEAKAAMKTRPVALESILQPNLKHPTARPAKRDRFVRDFIRKGIPYIFKKYAETPLSTRIRLRIFGALGKIKRTIIPN